jgi:hypothetical protein
MAEDEDPSYTDDTDAGIESERYEADALAALDEAHPNDEDLALQLAKAQVLAQLSVAAAVRDLADVVAAVIDVSEPVDDADGEDD